MPEFQCAVASSARGEPLFATASQVRRWLLIEVRGTWGRDAVDHTDLGRHVDDEWRARMRSAGVRVIAIRRDLDRAGEQLLRIFAVDSESRSVWRRDVAGLNDVPRSTEAWPGDSVAPDGWQPHDEDLVLVCTNGKHDACCAAFGRPVVRVLRASRFAELVWECSHIGGDRFAGNVVMLPDGHYFGRCNPDVVESIVAAYRAGHLDLDHYRGRSTLGYTHQAAEYFSRRELGLADRDAVASVRRVGPPGDGRFVATLADSSRATVTVRRTIEQAGSSLTCSGPGDVTLPRYALVEFDRWSERPV